MTKRLTLLIRANNKNSKRCMTARSAILVQCANGTLHTAELGFFPLQSRAHRLHEVIGTQQETPLDGVENTGFRSTEFPIHQHAALEVPRLNLLIIQV